MTKTDRAAEAILVGYGVIFWSLTGWGGVLALIGAFKGLRLEAYRDQAGVWTIGYGTTSRVGIGFTVEGGMKITERQAEEWLRAEIEKVAAHVAKEVKPRITPISLARLYLWHTTLGLAHLAVQARFGISTMATSKNRRKRPRRITKQRAYQEWPLARDRRHENH